MSAQERGKGSFLALACEASEQLAVSQFAVGIRKTVNVLQNRACGWAGHELTPPRGAPSP
jgi:hypothetical protein